MGMVGLDDDTPIENRLVTKSLEGAQVKVEGHHFETRKHLLEYDDVLNNQRQMIYAERRKALVGDDLKANTLAMVRNAIEAIMSRHLPAKVVESWNIPGFLDEVGIIFPLPVGMNTEEDLSSLKRNEIEERLTRHAEEMYDAREEEMGADNMRLLERLLMLRTVDIHWVHHLTAMDNLRQGIGLHAFGQRDPLIMYKTEGSRMFQALRERMEHDIVHSIYQASIAPARGAKGADSQPKASPMAAASGRRKEAVPVGAQKVGRNEQCPCGSGKKYKRCHGASA
jgi:preprotein translocase subunit SecA